MAGAGMGPSKSKTSAISPVRLRLGSLLLKCFPNRLKKKRSLSAMVCDLTVEMSCMPLTWVNIRSSSTPMVRWKVPMVGFVNRFILPLWKNSPLSLNKVLRQVLPIENRLPLEMPKDRFVVHWSRNEFIWCTSTSPPKSKRWVSAVFPAPSPLNTINTVISFLEADWKCKACPSPLPSNSTTGLKFMAFSTKVGTPGIDPVGFKYVGKKPTEFG